jgi:hypothetical protein
MLDSIQHDKLAYPLPVGGNKIGIDNPKEFSDLLHDNEIHTFVISGKRFIAAFELDRLILKLMRQEVQREFVEGHGTGVQNNG